MGRGWLRVVIQILQISIRPGCGTAPQAWEELGRTNGTGWAQGGDPDPTDVHQARVWDRPVSMGGTRSSEWDGVGFGW